MQLEIGKIYDGKVKGITNYGAFVEVPVEGEKPITGMVHISEVANTFVNDIREFLTEEQDVKVKVLQINEQGKISMSIKKAMPEERSQQRPRRQGDRDNRGERGERSDRSEQGGRSDNRSRRSDRGTVWEPKPQKPPTEMTFEDMMNRFKQNSEERMCDIKRNTDRKNGSRRRSK